MSDKIKIEQAGFSQATKNVEKQNLKNKSKKEDDRARKCLQSYWINRHK
jgi:DNA-binding MarR family transcriptional regulator